MKMLQIEKRLQAYIQFVVLKRTWESILIDLKGSHQGDWTEEEMSQLMGRHDEEPGGPEEEEL